VGYAGGESSNPTYHNLGGHTESLEVDFDPAQLSFSEVLELFWMSHNPHAAPRSSQYMSALFWHDAEQRACAEDSAARISGANGGVEVTTKILALDGFHLAEDYHQKYVLRRHRDFESVLLEVYPDLVEFTNSTATARLNGYLAGYGTLELLAHDLPLLGLSLEAQERLSTRARQ
jgi:peptide-methionine (S)-S-oxide reductase